VKGEYNSIKGLIRSEWKREGSKIRLEVEIPINTTATIEVMDKKIPVEGGKHTFKF
jgi:alpha-L-rhamnosidase